MRDRKSGLAMIELPEMSLFDGLKAGKKERKAFTLVELLVVIGIIAVLISVLLPTLAGARQRAAGVQCLSNLRQQGMAAVIYANLNRGYFPSAVGSSIYLFSESQAAVLSRALKGDTKVFYCPTNTLLPPGTTTNISTDDFYPPDHNGTWVPATSGRILYWWVGNPPDKDYSGALSTYAPDTDARFAPAGLGYVRYRDANGNGSLRDEYMRKLGDKNSANVVLSTDWSGQLTGGRGWFFIHGKQAQMEPTATPADAKKLYRAWKNNLYGDGHAESKRPDEVQWHWGPAGPVCW